jgi:transposase, IS30 family
MEHSIAKLKVTMTHLSQTERCLIQELKSINWSDQQIADKLKRHRSTIYREQKRNKGQRGYRHKQAQQLAQERSQNSRNAKRIQADIFKEVEEQLRQEHSPEQIAASLPISHTRIYQHIRADKKANGTLYTHCRCQKIRRKKYGSSLNGRGHIPNRRGIEQRPESVQTREKIGHWEGDTIIGANNQHAIVTLVERKTGLLLMQKVERKTAALVRAACIDLLKPYKHMVKTITFDNGKEFAEHAAIDAALGSTSYFADPYSSWQRGSNENTNGLIRQYIPKKRHFSNVSAEEVRTIMHKLNNRHRKRLQFTSPLQAVFKKFTNCCVS